MYYLSRVIGSGRGPDLFSDPEDRGDPRRPEIADEPGVKRIAWVVSDAPVAVVDVNASEETHTKLKAEYTCLEEE